MNLLNTESNYCCSKMFPNDPSSSVHSDKPVEYSMSTPSSFKKTEIEFEDDPAAFSQIKVLTPDLIDYFFKKGPSQSSSNDLPSKIFPKDIHGRCFHENWYWKNSPSRELSRRKWLSYSKKLDNIFCHYCALFGKNEQINWSRHKEGWKDEIRGNFKDLAILLAKYSPPLTMHINEIQNYGRKTQNFLSWQRQNQLIQAISVNIKNVLQQELFNAHYFSISLDSTFNVSKKEQLSMYARQSTEKHVFTMFDEICGELNLNWKEFLVGQSFDGAASMRGQYNGLQSFIKKQNPLSCCIEARDLFGNLEMLYDFIGSSKHRVNLYSSYQKKNYPGKPLRQLKRVETTHTLHSLESDDASHRVCSVKANGLMEYLLSEPFVLTGILFIKIFDMTSPLSKFLQKKNIDLLAAINYVQNILTRIKNLRNDIKFINSIDQKNKFIQSKQNDYSFTPINKNVHCNFRYFDNTNERFNENLSPFLPVDAFNAFGSIHRKFCLADILRKEYLQFCSVYFSIENLIKLPQKLHENDILHYHTDDEEEEEEEEEIEATEEDQKTTSTIYAVCHSTGLKDVFPNIYIALTIILTLPVSSASPERAFSKLKIIKNRLRSTMSEDRLEGLMLITCERDVPVNPDELRNSCIISALTNVTKLSCRSRRAHMIQQLFSRIMDFVEIAAVCALEVKRRKKIKKKKKYWVYPLTSQ
ncbi:zinc finger MYM-type protein 1-like [Aphis craccivora]|uniref:Zinc finger MYM-type protein 1-like n=1 Tax=Aphis craccivora TaxID=307492 RepID=A0A6G0Y4P1_APHCR|nr:zinc finger MYM-type protein 1-like [Aphis craccivora]